MLIRIWSTSQFGSTSQLRAVITFARVCPLAQPGWLCSVQLCYPAKEYAALTASARKAGRKETRFMPIVTCAALLAALADPAGGTSLQLNQDCANVFVKTYYKAPLVINAAGHTITRFFVSKDAGNLTLKGGKVTAQQGESGRGPTGYAV
jgi:hypothetical protein